MQKRQCPNGHIYDPSIYGDQCPLCPQTPVPSSAPAGSMPETHLGGAQMATTGGHTQVVKGPSQGFGMPVGTTGTSTSPSQSGDVSGATMFRPKEAEPNGQQGGGHTVIRRPQGATQAARIQGRKLVGFLVTYNRHPEGKAYNIYEGRNYVGRDASCDISVPDDDQMSGKHMSILYRNVDNKFKFRDEQSSNGTFINSELQDDGELNNYDIIRAGSTIFIFIAIPT